MIAPNGDRRGWIVMMCGVGVYICPPARLPACLGYLLHPRDVRDFGILSRPPTTRPPTQRGLARKPGDDSTAAASSPDGAAWNIAVGPIVGSRRAPAGHPGRKFLGLMTLTPWSSTALCSYHLTLNLTTPHAHPHNHGACHHFQASARHICIRGRAHRTEP